MRDFFDHAAEARRIRTHDDLVELAQSQASDNHLVLLRRADGTAHQFDLDLPFHYAFSGARPRISRMATLSRNCSRATTVAFTTLCGLCVPIDFVSTLGIPTAWITARTGPPATTPVPSGAGLSNTSPLPKRPSTE